MKSCANAACAKPLTTIQVSRGRDYCSAKCARVALWKQGRSFGNVPLKPRRT